MPLHMMEHLAFNGQFNVDPAHDVELQSMMQSLSDSQMIMEVVHCLDSEHWIKDVFELIIDGDCMRSHCPEFVA